MVKKTGSGKQPVGYLELIESHIGKRLSGSFFPIRLPGTFLEEAGTDVVDGVFQPLGEFFEVLLIKEKLVLVVGKGAVPFLAALAFGDGQIKVVIAFGRLYIETLGSLAGAYRLGVHVL